MRAFEDARRLHESGKLADALTKYRRALGAARRERDEIWQAIIMTNLGSLYNELNQPAEAIKILKEALTIMREEIYPPDEGEATVLENLGNTYLNMGQYEEALTNYEKSLDIWREETEPVCESRVLRSMGDVFALSGDTDNALSHYEQSLRIAEKTDKNWTPAHSQRLLAEICFNMKRPQRALEHYKKALELFQKSGNRKLYAAVLYSTGVVTKTLGHNKDASSYLEQALAEQEKLGLHDSMPETLYVLGIILEERANTSRAIEYHLESLRLSRARQYAEGILKNLETLATLYQNTGQEEKAEEYFQNALRLCREKGDLTREGILFLNRAIHSHNHMRLQDAFQFFHKSLDIFRRAKNKKYEGMVLNQIGSLDSELGNKEEALQYYKESFHCLKQASAPKEEADVRIKLAMAYNSRSQWNEALEHLEQALTLSRVGGDLFGEKNALLNLSAIYEKQGNLSQALQRCSQALDAARQLGNPAVEGECLEQLGILCRDTGQLDQAESFFKRALDLAKKFRHHWGEAKGLSGLGNVCFSRGRFAEALDYFQQAIAIAEKNRLDILDPDLRSGYFLNFHYLFLNCIMACLSLEKKEEAHFYAEKRSARTLLELLGEAYADIRKAGDRDLLEREHAVLTEIRTIRQRLNNANARDNQEIAAELRNREKELERQYLVKQTEILKNNQPLAHILKPETWDVRTIQKELLDEKTALLHFVLDDPISFLFVITSRDIRTFNLAGQEKIEDLARQLRGEVLKREHTGGGAEKDAANFCQVSFALYEALLKPVEPLIKEKEYLIVIPDGALYYIPFSLLITHKPDPKTVPGFADLPYLIHGFTISYAPSASVAGFLKQRGGQERDDCWEDQFIAFGEPMVVQSSRTDLRAQRLRAWNFPAIKATHAEITGIASLFGEISKPGKIRGDGGIRVYLGKVATKQAVLDCFKPGETYRSARFVHFATHGILDEEKPRFSGLVFSSDSIEDPFISTFEIFNLRFQSDMVVLSACETGLGKHVTGEGLVGLARAFFYAGTRSVCASLWKVADKATANLMILFYRSMLESEPGNRSDKKARALRQAQVKLIKQGGIASHPFFWATFVLIGDPG